MLGEGPHWNIMPLSPAFQGTCLCSLEISCRDKQGQSPEWVGGLHLGNLPRSIQGSVKQCQNSEQRGQPRESLCIMENIQQNANDKYVDKVSAA